MDSDRILVGAIAVLAVIIFFMAFSRLRPNARLQRRLKKTHSRIVSKARRPSVQLSVKPPKDK